MSRSIIGLFPQKTSCRSLAGTDCILIVLLISLNSKFCFLDNMKCFSAVSFSVVSPRINFPLHKRPSLFFPLRQNVLFGEFISEVRFFQNCVYASSGEILTFNSKILVQSLALSYLVCF